MFGLLFRLAQHSRERILEDVVAEDDQAARAGTKQFGQTQRLGDASGLVLDAVSYAAAEFPAGAE